MYLRRGTRQVCSHAHSDALKRQLPPHAISLVHAQRVIRERKHHVASKRSAAFHTGIGLREPSEDLLAAYKKTFDIPAASHSVSALAAEHVGQEVVLYGYIDTIRVMSRKLVFADLLDANQSVSVQIVCAGITQSSGLEFKDTVTQTPIAVRGVVQTRKDKPAQSADTGLRKVEDVEVKLVDFHVFNQFPADIKFSPISTFGPEQRHLQLRHGSHLRSALAFRSKLASVCRNYLQQEHTFVEIETPQLFKSTPEGAREFLVPTRTPGHAYALPQSPQQYKQILMASGIPRYFQIARCFRDEDLRADRQPEFTQLDLEMSFARGKDVMDCIEGLVRHMWTSMLEVDLGADPFTRMTYHDAMSRYGSDKPDTRLGMEITRVGHLLPVDLVSKIGPLADPIVEAIKFSPTSDPNATRAFVSDFMSSPGAAPFLDNPAGQPGIFIFDPRKPLSGLSPFGFEAAEFLEEHLDLAEGDMVVIQARPEEPFSGGSTPLGNLRLALHHAAVTANLIPQPDSWSFLWITDFPLFTPCTAADAAAGEGQGGSTGLASTHHPFTAPASPADVDKLATAPLDATAEHYDLVLNGVEIGGGSKRIHHAAVQDLVLRRVLGLAPEHVERTFGHLLAVLRAGCPPHAGIALGFDRLVATMLRRESIRDVIAFPKDGKGRDATVGSPAALTPAQLETYHLRLATLQDAKD